MQQTPMYNSSCVPGAAFYRPSASAPALTPSPCFGPPAAPSPRPSPCFGPTVVPGPYYGPMGGHHAPNPCFGPAPTRRPGACFASAASLRVSPQHCSTQPRRFDPCFL
ncbi:hypothetical protein EVAR_20062_1 [Eumeta japonica]|uniref:Uncharacterized protein n=1 Tax=Eumeta variegata TaxID=151549 RepID=A0A4C1UI06_EUMVA|nr:hypothetical protein EVAR_20062_1 [Eumeta japonica]